MFLTFFWLILTLGISIWNASVSGRYFSERSRLPVWTQIMIWCGATMATCGFFCVTVTVITMILHDLNLFPVIAEAVFKVSFEPSEIEELVQDIFNLAYLFVIFPILGTGIMITVNSWIVANARRDWASAGVAVYNTGAQIWNTARAVRYVPQASRSLGSSFKLKLGKDSGKAVAYLFLFFLPIVISLGISIAATAIIMKASDEKYQLEDLQ